MAESKDARARFMDLLGEWERTSNALANQLMGSGEFSRGMNSATNLGLLLQQQVQEHMSRMLAGVNLPSREEVAELGATVRRMDERLARIEAMLAGIGRGAAAEPPRPRPPRTRKPQGKMEAQ